MKYGSGYYDFDEGVMSFISPGQLVTEPDTNDNPLSGWLLIIQPDFARNYHWQRKLRGMIIFLVRQMKHYILPTKKKR